MRVIAAALLVLALGGCARMDQEIARVRAQISLRDLPRSDPADPAPADEVAECEGAYDADFSRGRHERTRIGGVVFVDLRTDEAWRYATARAYARHLSEKDDMREELLDHGADFHVARFAHVIVPGGRTATIAVDEPENFAKVGLIPGGPSRFGGYSATDGVTVLRCEAGPATTTFPLGIVVEGPRCASITVQLDGEAAQSKLVPFGRKQCP